ncbi:MAG TPA: zinc ribbon domain-containing protein [Firmicutes bacterium]|nr:zinc ribbon domain-containing protein [Bacillota bacterium]
MPNYEYRCRDCDQRFEIHAPANDKPQHPICTHCQSTNTHTVFSVYAMGRCNKSTVTNTRAGGCTGCSGGNCSSCH